MAKEDFYSYITSIFPKEKYANLVYFPPDYPSNPAEIRIFYKYIKIFLRILSEIKILPKYGYNRLITELRRPFRYLTTETIVSVFRLIQTYTKKEYFEAKYYDGFVLVIESEGYTFLNNLIQCIQEFLNSLSLSLKNKENEELYNCNLGDFIATLELAPNLNQEEIRNILSVIANLISEIRFSPKMNLPVVRKLLKYGVFTEDVLNCLYNARNMKNINKLINEFPLLHNAFLCKNLENGLTENVDENIIENMILEKIEKMPVLNLIKDWSSELEEKSDLALSVSLILKNNDLQSYVKDYFMAILGNIS